MIDSLKENISSFRKALKSPGGSLELKKVIWAVSELTDVSVGQLTMNGNCSVNEWQNSQADPDLTDDIVTPISGKQFKFWRTRFSSASPLRRSFVSTDVVNKTVGPSFSQKWHKTARYDILVF